MDYSGVADGQQQQQQYHQQYQEHEQQQAYDPAAQSHAYDAYYASHHHHYDPSAPYHPQSHHYYAHAHAYSAAPAPDPSPAAAAAAPPSSSLPAAAHDSAQIHHGYAAAAEQPAAGSYDLPPGLNPAAAAAVAALSQLTQFAGTMDAAERAMMQERAWHGNGGVGGGGSGEAMSPATPHHQHHPMQHGAVSARPGIGGRPPYRGGGRRGGGPFRGGGGRGNFGRYPPRQDVGAPPSYRGRGRGRSGRIGGRRFQQSTETQSSSSASLPVREPSSMPDPQKEPGQGQAQAIAPATAAAFVSAPVLPRRPLLPIAWCDICRVDCNSLEILEQHKNGKRHKKTVQRVQEIEAQQKLMAEYQAKFAAKAGDSVAAEVGEANKAFAAVKNMPAAVFDAQVGEAKKVPAASESWLSATSAQVGGAAKSSAETEIVPAAFLPIERNMESKVQNQSVESKVQNQSVDGQSESVKGETASEVLTADFPQPDAPSSEAAQKEGQTRRPRMDTYDRYDRRCGSKWKMMRSGPGGKRMRKFEPVRSRPPERPREQPRVCTLCNVMCDTLAVFESHLSGKKHISRIKRFQGQDTVFGPISVYIPPNQPTAYPPQAPEPVFYGLKSHEMLQQEVHAFTGLQLESVGQQDDQAEETRKADSAALESQAEQGSEHLKDEVPIDAAQETVTMDAEGQNAVVEFEAKDDNQSAVASEIVVTEEIACAEPEDAVPVLEYGVPSGGDVVLPGLSAKEEPAANNEEAGIGVDMSQ